MVLVLVLVSAVSLVLVLVLALSLALVLVLGVEIRSKDRNVCRKGASLSPILRRAAQCCRLCREARFGVCVVGCCLLVQRKRRHRLRKRMLLRNVYPKGASLSRIFCGAFLSCRRSREVRHSRLTLLFSASGPVLGSVSGMLACLVVR